MSASLPPNDDLQVAYVERGCVGERVLFRLLVSLLVRHHGIPISVLPSTVSPPALVVVTLLVGQS